MVLPVIFRGGAGRGESCLQAEQFFVEYSLSAWGYVPQGSGFGLQGSVQKVCFKHHLKLR